MSQPNHILKSNVKTDLLQKWKKKKKKSFWKWMIFANCFSEVKMYNGRPSPVLFSSLQCYNYWNIRTGSQCPSTFKMKSIWAHFIQKLMAVHKTHTVSASFLLYNLSIGMNYDWQLHKCIINVLEKHLILARSSETFCTGWTLKSLAFHTAERRQMLIPLLSLQVNCIRFLINENRAVIFTEAYNSGFAWACDF